MPRALNKLFDSDLSIVAERKDIGDLSEGMGVERRSQSLVLCAVDCHLWLPKTLNARAVDGLLLKLFASTKRYIQSFAKEMGMQARYGHCRSGRD